MVSKQQFARLHQSAAIKQNSLVKQSWNKLQSLINSVSTPPQLAEPIPHSRPSSSMKIFLSPQKRRPYSAKKINHNQGYQQRKTSYNCNPSNSFQKKSSKSLLEHEKQYSSASPYKNHSNVSLFRATQQQRQKHRNKSKRLFKRQNVNTDIFSHNTSFNQSFYQSPDKSQISISMTKIQPTDVPSTSSPTPIARKIKPIKAVKMVKEYSEQEPDRKQSPLFFKVRSSKPGSSPQPFANRHLSAYSVQRTHPYSGKRPTSAQISPGLGNFASMRSSTPQMEPLSSIFDESSFMNQSYVGQSYSSSASPVRKYKFKSSALVTIEQAQINSSDEADAREETLSAKEQYAIFLSKCADLKIQYFQNQFLRFQEYCVKNCMNRKVALKQMGLSFHGARVISQLICNNKNMAHLDIRKNQIGDRGACIIAHTLRRSLSLIHLNIQSNEIGYEGGIEIFKALETNQSVVSLDISSSEGLHRNRIGPKGMPTISQVLKTNKVLTFLNISGNAIGNEGLLSLVSGLKGNKILEFLGIANNDISFNGIQALMEVIPSTIIKDLDISMNPLNNQGIQSVSAFLGALCPIRKINISDCKFNSIGAQFLYTNLKRSGGLMVIICDNNDLFGSSLQDIGTMLMTNNSLALASFNSCNLKDQGAYYIADALKKCPKMHTLNVQRNQISDQGGLRFASALSQSQVKLKNLDLSSNSLSDRSGVQIAIALKTNTALEVLNLRDNNLHNKSGQMFSEVSKSNRNIKSIQLKYNSIAVKFVRQIYRAIVNNTDLSRKDIVPNYQSEIQRLKGTSDKIVSTKQEIEDIKEKIKVHENIFEHQKGRLERVQHQQQDKYEILMNEANRMKILYDKVDDEFKRKDDEFKESREQKKSRILDLEFKIHHGVDQNEKVQKQVESKNRNIESEKQRLEEEMRKLYAELENQKRKLTVAQLGVRSYETQVERKKKEIEIKQKKKEQMQKQAAEQRKRARIKQAITQQSKEEDDDDRSMITKSSKIDFSDTKELSRYQRQGKKKKQESKNCLRLGKRGKSGNKAQKGAGKGPGGKKMADKTKTQKSTIESSNVPFAPQKPLRQASPKPDIVIKGEKKTPSPKKIGQKKRKASPIDREEEFKTITSDDISSKKSFDKTLRPPSESPVTIISAKKDPAILKIEKMKK